jgi:hypothetical protein
MVSKLDATKQLIGSALGQRNGWLGIFFSV